MTKRVFLGESYLTLPDGWAETERVPDRVTFRAGHSPEWATVSRMDFTTAPSFDHFKRLCVHRLTAEKQNAKADPSTLAEPTDHRRVYTFMFSGHDATNGRFYSGYMVMGGSTLNTVYVEGFGVTVEHHIDTYKAFVSGFRPRELRTDHLS